MKLKKEQIQKLSDRILADLKKSGTVTFSVSEDKISAKIADVIFKDMQAEVQLEEDARKLLETYRSQMGTSLDEHKMLQMIKKQLAKERKMTL